MFIVSTPCEFRTCQYIYSFYHQRWLPVHQATVPNGKATRTMQWLLGEGSNAEGLQEISLLSSIYLPLVATTHLSHRARLHAYFVSGCAPLLSPLSCVGRCTLAGPSQIYLARTQATVRCRLSRLVEGYKRRLAPTMINPALATLPRPLSVLPFFLGGNTGIFRTLVEWSSSRV